MKNIAVAFVMSTMLSMAFAEQCQHYELTEIKEMSKVALVNEFCSYRTIINMNSISQKKATDMQGLAIKHNMRKEEAEAKASYEKLQDQNTVCENESSRISKALGSKKVTMEQLNEKCPAK